MNHADYCRYDATGLAQLIGRGEIGRHEALAAARDRLEQVNPVLNCVVTSMTPQALARSKHETDGPFAHVPFLIKDLFQDYAGVDSTCGNQALKRARFKPSEHAELVQRFLGSGVNIIGRTNTPEFGTKAVTEPVANGVTRNPWHLEHTPGGSSGGSAAAVAAGIVPMAGANDGGGSIRIPAACCGLFGLKPGRARVPGGPSRIDMMHGGATDHVLTRSVRDSATMLDAISGYEPGAIVRIATPEIAYRKAIDIDPPRLRIGVMTESPLGHRLHAETTAAIEHTIGQLIALGHEVTPAAPAIDGQQLCADFLSAWFVKVARLVDSVRQSTDARWSEFELDTRAMAHLGRSFSAVEYNTVLERWVGYRRALALFHEQYDLLLTPTLAGPPVAIGAVDTPTWQRRMLRVALRLPSARALRASSAIDQTIQRNLKQVPFTQLANLTGTPAMSVPLFVGDSGLPQGSQFVGPPGGETVLLQLAAQLERADPWFDRMPTLPELDRWRD